GGVVHLPPVPRGPSGRVTPTIGTLHPPRWFDANPQARSNHRKPLRAFNREVPTDWRAALGVAHSAPEATASECVTTSGRLPPGGPPDARRGIPRGRPRHGWLLRARSPDAMP